jgi:hypothetical protein
MRQKYASPFVQATCRSFFLATTAAKATAAEATATTSAPVIAVAEAFALGEWWSHLTESFQLCLSVFNA